MEWALLVGLTCIPMPIRMPLTIPIPIHTQVPPTGYGHGGVAGEEVEVEVVDSADVGLCPIGTPNDRTRSKPFWEMM